MPRPLLNAASYLALSLGLYMVASVVAFAQVAGVWQPYGAVTRWAGALVYAFCVGAGVYLLDRVKLADRWLDPADAVAHPLRAAFIAKHSRAVRGLMLTLLIGGAAVGATVSWVFPALTVASCAGVVMYAGRPRERIARPKDVLLVKNLCVSGAITAFSVVVVGFVVRPSVNDRAFLGAAVVAAVNLLVRVFSDAVVCDLEDEEADRAFATATLATRYGRTRAWNIASTLRLLLGVALMLIPIGPRGPRVAWGVVTVVSTLAIRAARPASIRDWVDLRFAIEAAAVSAAVLVI